MNDLPIYLNASDLEDFARRGLRNIRTAVEYAAVGVVNNAAFKIRTLAIERTIPAAMVVRNKGILRASLSVKKASKANPLASLVQTPSARFTGLREEEFGGEMTRASATLHARRGVVQSQIQGKARFKDDKFIRPENVAVANDTGSWEQRIAVMISQIERSSNPQSQPFIVHGHPKIHSGVLTVGKRLFSGNRPQPGRRRRGIGPTTTLTPAQRWPLRRKLTTLRVFHHGNQDVKRRPWLKPAIDIYRRSTDMRREWLTQMERQLDRSAKGWRSPPKK